MAGPPAEAPRDLRPCRPPRRRGGARRRGYRYPRLPRHLVGRALHRRGLLRRAPADDRAPTGDGSDRGVAGGGAEPDGAPPTIAGPTDRELHCSTAGDGVVAATGRGVSARTAGFPARAPYPRPIPARAPRHNGNLALRERALPQLASVTRLRDLDNDVCRVIVSAERTLTDAVGHDRWHSSRVAEVLPTLRAAVGSRPRVPRRSDLRRVRYAPITRPFEQVAELSWQIANLRGVTSGVEPGKSAGLLLDVAELWELFVLNCLRQALPPTLQLDHGTHAEHSDYFMRSRDGDKEIGKLKPDLLIRDGDTVFAVLDAKYKRLRNRHLSVHEVSSQETSTRSLPTRCATGPAGARRFSTRCPTTAARRRSATPSYTGRGRAKRALSHSGDFQLTSIDVVLSFPRSLDSTPTILSPRQSANTTDADCHQASSLYRSPLASFVCPLHRVRGTTDPESRSQSQSASSPRCPLRVVPLPETTPIDPWGAGGVVSGRGPQTFW